MNEERMQRAERLLAEVRAAGCVVAVENGMVTFRPPPAAKVLLEMEDLKEELLRLLQPLSLVTTELGFEVPPRPDEEWRGHTAERWKRDDRESYDLCCELIRSGMVNQSELSRIVGMHRKRRGEDRGISRNSIHALMMSDEFGPGEIEEIIGKAARITTAQALDKVAELVDKVKKPKDLGAVAMALTTVHNVKQISSGRPTSIVEKRDRFSMADFERMKLEAARKMRDVTPKQDPQTIAEGGCVPLTMVDGGFAAVPEEIKVNDNQQR